MKNKAVLRTMTMGLSAAMVLQPMAVFAEEPTREPEDAAKEVVAESKEVDAEAEKISGDVESINNNETLSGNEAYDEVNEKIETSEDVISGSSATDAME